MEVTAAALARLLPPQAAPTADAATPLVARDSIPRIAARGTQPDTNTLVTGTPQVLIQ